VNQQTAATAAVVSPSGGNDVLLLHGAAVRAGDVYFFGLAAVLVEFHSESLNASISFCPYFSFFEEENQCGERNRPCFWG
jgi:hypothetical protein